MTISIDYQNILSLFRANERGYPDELHLRIHRSLSWLKKAESCGEDSDIRLLTLWIAFNAAYAAELNDGSLRAERGRFQEFLQTVCRLDQERQIYPLVWQTFSSNIRLLLDNRYTFQPFWDFHNGYISEAAWLEQFEQARTKALKALANQDTDAVLFVVFDRLYTLRNQLVHGGATYHSRANRKQVQYGCAILSALVPVVLQIMLQHPDQDWGKPFYPYVSVEE